MEAKRTERGKIASNSKPVCDLVSWCSNPAINIKHGFGMGFQLGPLAPLPGAQQPHPSLSQRGELLAGQLQLEEQDASLFSLPSFPLLPLITLIADWGKKEFKNLYLSVGTHQNWSRFFPCPATGRDTKPRAEGKCWVLGSGDGASPTAVCLQGVRPAKAAVGSQCAGFIPSEGYKTSLQRSCNATQNCISTEYQCLCRNVSSVHCKYRRACIK